MILSNTGLAVVQEAVRQNALRDFAFYANGVLSSQLSEELCAAVQDAVMDRTDVFIVTAQPRALALALNGWLTSQGIAVLTTAQLPSCEVLRWLDLQNDDTKTPTEGCTIDLQTSGVKIQWL